MKKFIQQAITYNYLLQDDWLVQAGKSNIDNDLLSLKEADANDYWFHIRGMAGSHVILRHHDDDVPSKEIIKTAAAIAAYHSKARNGGIVAVSQTLAKYVKKPRGAKAGTVTISHEKTIKVRPALPHIIANSHEKGKN